MTTCKTCLDPTCEGRQPECPWPESIPGERVNDIREVTEIEASRIVFKGVPRGKFYHRRSCWNERVFYIAIDNSTGEAWTEEFETLDACLEWLANPRAEAAG